MQLIVPKLEIDDPVLDGSPQQECSSALELLKFIDQRVHEAN